jgi:hypothetical protein
MISLETLVWLAPLLAAVVVVLTGLVDIWLTDRGRQSAHEQAYRAANARLPASCFPRRA